MEQLLSPQNKYPQSEVKKPSQRNNVSSQLNEKLLSDIKTGDTKEQHSTQGEIIDKNISNIQCSLFFEDNQKPRDPEEQKRYRIQRNKTLSILVDAPENLIYANSPLKNRSSLKKFTTSFNQGTLDNQQLQRLEQSSYHPKLHERQGFIEVPWNESLTYWRFEQMKTFDSYFPQYNYKQVLKNILTYKKNCMQKKKRDKFNKSLRLAITSQI